MPFRLYFLSRLCAEFSWQMLAVTIGWQVYALTGSAADLGLIGLAQFIPAALLTLPAGHAADRFDRKSITAFCRLAQGLAAACLAWSSATDGLTVSQLFLAVPLFGAAGAFEAPAETALLPALVPPEGFQRATVLTTAAFQLAIVAGPALGGVAIAVSPTLPFALTAGLWLLAAATTAFLPVCKPVRTEEEPEAGDLLAGARFIWREKKILGLISLDLAAVLLGGVTALLPIYAKDILQAGPFGLGLLRAAPAAGALVMSAFLARQGIEQRAGTRMLQAVAVFGIATVLFSLSHSLWLSVAALALAGAADTISMVIRGALLQLATPDAMRGRVNAVNFLFINASSQLGEFESGMLAALAGTMPAALLGGLGTIAVALAWSKLFPVLKTLERLD